MTRTASNKALATRPTSDVSPYDDSAAQPVDGTGAMAAFNNAGIDIQIATAHRFPRSISRFLKEAEDLVTANKGVAATCTYALPRGGKVIKGPSVRLAELCQYAWGNIRTAAMVTGDDGKFVVATAICLDLQKNSGYQIEARRRITDKNGKRFDDDMIGVTSNAAISIALRNGVFRVIPRTYVDEVHSLAMQVAAGSLEDLDGARRSWVESFVKKGVPEARVYAALGVDGIKDVTNDHLILLQGFQTSIKEGQATLEDIFSPPAPAAPAGVQVAPGESKAAGLARKIAGQQGLLGEETEAGTRG